MSGTTRVIKRYANRKLYDTQDSKYVTLDQIAELIRQSEDVLVVDNATKEDLTSITFAQIILEEEKRKRSFLPLSTLRKMIESSGESIHEMVTHLQESAGRMGRVFRREEAGPGAKSVKSMDLAVEGKLETPAPAKMLREFVEGIQQTIDEWQKKVDANVHSALESVSPLAPLQKEVHTLNARIVELEQKLARLTPETQDAPTGDPPASSSE